MVFIDVEQMKAIASRGDRENVYLIDVRTREEYAAGHIPGFRWAPGGQLVQATDNYLGVRTGTVVLACDDGNVRSSLTAAWLREMGFPSVYALDGGITAWTAAGGELEAGLSAAVPDGYGAVENACRIARPEKLPAQSRRGLRR